jgi:hypothetical protein
MKTTLKLILLTMIILSSDFTASAQYYFSADYSPKNCFESDSIIVTDSISMTTLDFRLNYAANVIGDTIFLNQCYKRPGGPQGIHRFSEKANIGTYLPGHYTIKITGQIGYFDDCSDTKPFFDTLYLSLDVKPNVTGFINDKYLDAKIQTVFSNEIKLDDIPLNSFIKIYDYQGRLCYSHFNDKKQTIIETSNWANGFYIVSIQTNGEQKRWRVLKD